MAETLSTQQAIQRLEIRPRYGNFVGGKFLEPVRGKYFTDPTPITGSAL